ncbi:MAG TPA: rhodanese-like domain-containing protein [Burkholderiales bacterium]|nr:rhodanese-like domain-containing protein [Burkholderiales bacterium]
MAEVDILKFLTDPWHMFLVAAAFASGAMLIWPLVRRAAAGASISTLQATLLINQQNALVLDVREAAEYEKGHMLNARNIAFGELEARAAEIEKHKAKPVIVACDDGNRSGRAATALRKRGFEQVFTLSGGIGAWRQAGLPLEK